jgi:myo-inositol 2-dehydrogenase/D-chiro-inositol 1-dehydrogenase/scyllo-inositol 2-dehydrogenase (NAD+)
VTGPLRIAVVGAGRAGLVHARNFAAGVPGGVLAALADPDSRALERAALEVGCERTFTDVAQAVTDDAIDGIVIASPTFTHAEIAVAALEAGKHVLCEKPLASSAEEGGAIAAAADSSEAAFLMGFMRRFDDGFVRAERAIRAGEIGEPLFVRSTGRGPGLPPEWAWDPDQAIGLIAEVNSHDLDTVRWLSGQEFVSVNALGRAAKRPDIAERYPGFVDLVVATFELSAGALAVVDGACPADYGYDARAEVYGSEGVVFAGDPRADSALVVRAGGAVSAPVRSWRDVFADAYRREDAHFVAVALGLEEPRTSIADGLHALEAALAVRASLGDGRRVDLAAATP